MNGERARMAGGPDDVLVADLVDAGVVLVADGDRLRVRAPRGVLTPDLRDRLERRRDAVRGIVAGRYRGPRECAAAARGLRRPCRRMSGCAEPAEGRPCLMAAACCLCGAALEPGRVYVCAACAEAGVEANRRRWSK